MNIYKGLNEITKFIDTHLEEDIHYEDLARILGVNVYIMQRIFTMIAGIPLAEYIRKRRLSNAGYDLYHEGLKVVEVAMRYRYDNATSFSRAFQKFHGIKPSLVTEKTTLKNYPRILFDENILFTTELDYEIVRLEQMDLYGVSMITNNNKIGFDAPLFFKMTQQRYSNQYGDITHGMITYDSERLESQKYYCLYDKKIDVFEHISIPPSKWLKFRISSQNAKDIQEISHKFYREFLPSCKYNLKELPELEYYHDGITDFLVAIY